MNTWTIDPAHSSIGFKIKHLMVSTVRGQFKEFDGRIETADDTFGDAHAHFTAKSASIDTNMSMRDDHLRSADMFDSERFPEVTFVSEAAVVDGNRFDIAGDLTMKGVTKRIALHGIFEGIAVGMDGARVAAFTCNGTINRNDFGISWNKALEAGGVTVGEEVVLELHIEAKENAA